jgi:uncharacterized membrane protein YgcG
MKRTLPTPAMAMLLIVAVTCTSGCGYFRRAKMLYQKPASPATLGTLSDPIFSNQESNAEALDFIVYQHEFVMDATRLNDAGQDHIKQIAARILDGQDMLVMVERSRTSVKEGTEYKYPVHLNPELDMKRREVLVRSLAVMGVEDADDRVVVAPVLRPGYKATEATQAYQRGMSLFGGGGFGGGGFGGGGFGGGFGGGGFF